MTRLSVLLLALAVVIPAGWAVRAQESPGGASSSESLDDLIRDLESKLAAAASREEPAGLRFVLRMYDIRDLTFPVRDYPGDSINLVPSGGFGFGAFEGDECEPMAYYEGDAIVDLIRETVAPVSWDELASAEIRYLGSGNLVVRQTPGVQERIGALLDELRRKAAAQITLRVRLLRIRDADLRAALSDGSAFILDEGGEERLAREVADGRVHVVKDGTISCTNNQRVSLADLAQTTYVQDYDVEIAEGSAIGDPILALARDGLIVELEPTVAGRGDLVVLGVRCEAGKIDRPIRSMDLPLGSVDLPAMEILKLRTCVALPLGRTVVVGGALADGDEDALLLLVTPTATRYGGR